MFGFFFVVVIVFLLFFFFFNVLKHKKEAEQGIERSEWQYHGKARASLGYVENKKTILSLFSYKTHLHSSYLFEIRVLLCSPGWP